MMKKFILLVILFIYSNGLAQKIPQTYSLQENQLAKISDSAPASNVIEFIEFNQDTIWLGTSAGLSKSTDFGDTWTNITFGEEGISALAINNDTVWCATWHLESNPLNPSNDLPVGSGIHYSVDGGKSWIDIPQPVDASDDSSIVYGINSIRALPITTEINNFTRSIAFTHSTIWIASFAGELRKSNNNGNTWERVVIPPDYLDEIHPTDTLNFTLSPTGGNLGFEDNLNHRVFALAEVNDSTIYVGTANGINKTTDNGLSWRKFNHQNQAESISGNFIVNLAYDKFRDVIWAASWKAEDQDEFYAISASKDEGNSWNTYLPGMRIHDIAFVEDKVSNNFFTKEVLAATEVGIFRSPDYGISWLSAPEMSDDISGSVLTTNSFRSVNAKYLKDENQSFWFGSLDGLANLTETDGLWEGKWRIFVATANTTQENIQETYAFPNPFSPDDEVIRFKYDTNNKVSKVSIRIFDFGMNLVRTVVQNVTRTINKNSSPVDFWDGRDENGVIVSNGVYFYRIDIDENTQPIWGKIIVMM